MNTLFGRKTNTKRALSHLMMTSALVAAGTLVLSSSAMAAPWDDMTGLGFTRTIVDPTTTNIAATTVNGKASGTGNLDILNGQTVNINAKLFVARDNRPTIQTKILGNLNSNGTVVLIDRNGIIFGKNSRVDVGSLIASTGDLDNNQALADGDAPLFFSNFGTGEIINKGVIKAVGTAGDYGLVAFVGPVVKNNGVINAYMGRVSLAAGNETATVDLYGDGLVSLAYTNKNDDLLAENNGKIEAIGGKIQMTAAAAKNVVDSVVNMNGIARADSATVNGGKIILSAKKVNVGAYAKVKGNTTITAKTVKLGTTIDGTVSGSADKVKVLSDKAKIAQGLNIINTNGTIDVAAGTYNEHLVVDKAGVTLNGANAGKAGWGGSRGAETLVNPKSPGVTITADGVTVDGMMFAGATGADGYGILVDNADNVTLKNNVINNTSQSGIYVINANNLSILNNFVANTVTKFYGMVNGVGGSNWNISGNKLIGAYYGVNLIGVGGTNTIDNNDINNMKVEGVHIENINNVTIINNKIGSLNGWINGNGIHIQGPDNGTVVISNNTLDRNKISIFAEGQDGVQILDNKINHSYLDAIRTTDASGTMIDGNDIFWVADKGIRMIGGGDVTVSNNTFDTVYGNAINGVDVAGADILNNTITNAFSYFYGIIHAQGGSDWNVTSNNLDGGYYGISLTDVSGTTIVDDNTVRNMKVEGVHVENLEDVTISNNTIGSTNGWTNANGIHIQGPDNGSVIISDNQLDRNKISIFVEGQDNVQILDNKIDHSYLDGIRVSNATGTLIDGNNIYWVADKGIRLLGGADVTVQNNVFDTVFGNAIHGSDIEGANILDNTMTNVYSHFYGIIQAAGGSAWNVAGNNLDSGYYGINLTDVSGISAITNNTVRNTKVEGVHVEGLENVTISGNTIGSTNGYTLSNGIHVYGSDMGTATVSNNALDSNKVSIYIEGANNAQVLGNNITNSYAYGINSEYTENTVIDGNTITTSGIHGIYSQSDTDSVIDNNIISDIEVDGIHAEGIQNTMSIQGNTITNVGNDGIYVQGYGKIIFEKAFAFADESEGATPPIVTISGNTISNASVGESTSRDGFAGIEVDLGQDGYVAISNNQIGNNFEYGLYATSGEIDLTGAANTIQNTGIGMGFYPYALNIPNEGEQELFALAESVDFFALGSMLRLTGNTIGATNFIDQSQAFVDLGLGAFFEPGLPTILDGLQATYTTAGVTIDPASQGNQVTQSEQDYLESMFNHYVDSNDRGLFFFPVIPASESGVVDQKDIFREFIPLAGRVAGGSLTVTGLPQIATGGAAPTTGGTTPFNPADIEPAAGGESGDTTATQVSDIQPSAGEVDNSSCWSDATKTLGEGTAVTFNFGAGQSALLQDAANCGTGASAQGQGI
ncbi:MAG: hypothetical protein A3B66_07000 [Alphaproteobacteria bacterium RIFCSPHIGHO2_02_FULL_46_13]|nr:MAG: hypothetical protein A3B66_07000 [Alphaproteobacteria bacterium RIFCSPHIGHO2_02_FULL_46_13]